MKKFALALSILFALILSGCGSDSSSSTPAPESTSNASISDTVNTVDSAVISSLPVVSSNSNTPDVVEPDEITYKDMWTITTHFNHTPFMPDGYDGQVTDYPFYHINTNGIVSKVTYKIALISADDKSYDDKYGDYKSYCFQTEVDGKTVSGKTFWTTERFDFLRHSHDGIVDTFFLDVSFLPDDVVAVYDLWQSGIYIVAQNDNKVLMCGGSCLFTYDFQTAKTNLISDSVLNYKYPVEGDLYFTDWEHIERQVDWEHDGTITETGKKVIAYHNESFDLVIQDDFEKEFLAIREALRSGEATEETYAGKYNIYSSGSIYRISDANYPANIHLPHAYQYNSNLMHSAYDSYWLIEGSKLNLYHFGDVVRSYNLPDGRWRIIESRMSMCQDPTSTFVKYVVDTDNDGKNSPEELNAAIIDLNIMLMNVDESTVYVLNQYGDFIRIAADVADYREAYCLLYWMDSHGNAYCCYWLEDYKVNTLIGKDAIGISPFTDEGQGFLVKPDDSRKVYIREGFPVCLDWLGGPCG